MSRDPSMTPPSEVDFVLVQLVTYCERDNLEALLPELLGLPSRVHVLVVDDNSPDGTPDWLRRRAEEEARLHVLVRPEKLGYASATMDGFERARELGATSIVTMDADYSHDPQAVPGLLARLAEADVALGSRYVGGCRVLDWSLRRLFVSVMANGYVRTLLGLPFQDATSGFRAYRTDVLFGNGGLETMSSGGYSILVELLFRLHRTGARIVEHPIVYSERREGQSKMSKAVMLEAAWRPWALRLLPGRARRGGSRRG